MTTRRPADPDRSTAAKLFAQLEQRTEQLALINGVLRTIVCGAPLPEILKAFASNLKRLCPFDRCSISIYDERHQVFHRPYMIIDGRVRETKEEPRKAGATILSRVIETRQPLLRRNIRSDDPRFEADRRLLRKGFASELFFPLQVGDKPFGTFNLCAFEGNRLDERHVRLLHDVVPAIAVAVWQHLSREKFIFV